MDTVRNGMEAYLIEELEKIRKMPEGEGKNKAMNEYIKAYSEFNKEWRDTMEVQMQMDRLDLDRSKLEFERSKHEAEQKRSEAQQKIDKAKIRLGAAETGVQCGTFVAILKAIMEFEKDGNVSSFTNMLLGKMRIL